MAELFYGIANISTVAQLTLRTSVAEGTLEIVPVTRRGIWATEFVKPWAWRRGKRLAANDNAPTRCKIKGNINASGERIYHMPSQQAYNVTRIDSDAGERWFCSESEAKAAGWRKALR